MVLLIVEEAAASVLNQATALSIPVALLPLDATKGAVITPQVLSCLSWGSESFDVRDPPSGPTNSADLASSSSSSTAGANAAKQHAAKTSTAPSGLTTVAATTESDAVSSSKSSNVSKAGDAAVIATVTNNPDQTTPVQFTEWRVVDVLDLLRCARTLSRALPLEQKAREIIDRMRGVSTGFGDAGSMVSKGGRTRASTAGTDLTTDSTDNPAVAASSSGKQGKKHNSHQQQHGDSNGDVMKATQNKYEIAAPSAACWQRVKAAGRALRKVRISICIYSKNCLVRG